MHDRHVVLTAAGCREVRISLGYLDLQGVATTEIANTIALLGEDLPVTHIRQVLVDVVDTLCWRLLELGHMAAFRHASKVGAELVCICAVWGREVS